MQPGIPLARRAEVAPAATIIPASKNPLVQRGARSRITRIDPTAMICTKPRAIAIKASCFQVNLPPRASNTTTKCELTPLPRPGQAPIAVGCGKTF